MADFKRWYDEEPTLSRCFKLLENLDEGLKRQTATFLMTDIINKPPYTDMISDSIFETATGESNRRRWYDYDEIVRILVELLKQLSPEMKKDIAIKAIIFIEDIINENNDVDISIENE